MAGVEELAGVTVEEPVVLVVEGVLVLVVEGPEHRPTMGDRGGPGGRRPRQRPAGPSRAHEGVRGARGRGRRRARGRKRPGRCDDTRRRSVYGARDQSARLAPESRRRAP